MSNNTLKWLTLGLLCIAGQWGAQAATFDGTPSKWKGFEKISFQTDGQQSYVVLPNTPAQGNPWVWRARFPNWHTEIDQELLKQGYAIGYIDVKDLYGSPKAVAHWDAFYEFMVENGMAETVVLEGVSRGGLICFNWAKKNPDQVACIYVEAPVCDIKSWPGGKEIGRGSSNDWKNAQAAYGLDEDGLMAWADNPIDNLEDLAKAKVPIYAAISLQDQIVPPQENILKLMNRYIELGGPFTVYPMTEGEQQLDGHHFPIERIDLIADFVLSHTKGDE
jgi:sialidase-1